ncbi:type IV secretory pathway VirB3-like protein [Pseudomonas sp. BIGb0381]|uniref:VirB3 family type IV secretion system protein n=1 Tax=Pseudomonas sp. BIGb0381 TaxID=2940608 RepID=UPI002167E59D|nr:VirB3 family type IV secretion system protein [Pseudomonas sp. BIGb0381]MCS4315582.1 type IV secretory pathway VirB3-like protein [Pseudomonas sp. BIGb0381]
MSQEEEKVLLYPSYNAMSRPAMFWGVPIMPLVGLFLAAVIVFVITFTLLSFVWALVALLPFVIAVCGLRIMTSIDDRYIRRVLFSVHRLWLNLKHGKQLLLTPYSPLWSQYYGKRFSQQRFIAGAVKSPVDVLSGPRTHGDSERV